ncbi:hypothetical protein K438DRAFT_1658225 [Mycena galopus ATCC 62051]|nr:hypothetical protein K438DRAFT_1658225 [Mycena galopus ATCC 62051]
MSTPPAKRQRTEDASTIITRSEFWSRDGSVVLQAANKQFRVHWSVLERNSSVFREMQGLPQPPDQPSVDGCPVVEIFDDPVDVEYLLKALYVPTFLGQEKLSIAAVGALIRLGRKYDFKDIFDSAVARLMAECPTTLDEFDRLPSLAMKTMVACPTAYFDLVAIASENNILSALPCAYYCLVEMFSMNQLFDGIVKEDGKLASLSPVDLRRCLVAHEKLLIKQFQPGYIFAWARKREFGDCTDPAGCLMRRMGEIVVEGCLDRARIAILEPPAGHSNFKGQNFCDACIQDVAESMAAGRKKIWEELPGIFDLPPWNELKNM